MHCFLFPPSTELGSSQHHFSCHFPLLHGHHTLLLLAAAQAASLLTANTCSLSLATWHNYGISHLRLDSEKAKPAPTNSCLLSDGGEEDKRLLERQSSTQGYVKAGNLKKTRQMGKLVSHNFSSITAEITPQKSLQVQRLDKIQRRADNYGQSGTLDLQLLETRTVTFLVSACYLCCLLQHLVLVTRDRILELATALVWLNSGSSSNSSLMPLA